MQVKGQTPGDAQLTQHTHTHDGTLQGKLKARPQRTLAASQLAFEIWVLGLLMIHQSIYESQIIWDDFCMHFDRKFPANKLDQEKKKKKEKKEGGKKKDKRKQTHVNQYYD